MIQKLLVANRGEVARRIFRTCQEMGIATVAVFSEPDEGALFVAEADEAIALGGESPADSYLRIDAIIDAARRSGADAVHPGYGFLAENATFAGAVLEAGLIWVGPPPAVIAAMGSKLESKRLAVAAGVPTLDTVELTGLESPAIRAAGDRLGYPVLVKASAGGGGKGMRVVANAEALVEAVASAEREALSAFGDGTVFLEPYLTGPRHVEVQVFGDQHGHLVSLLERDCSIQRRHQKIIEESPSPGVDDRLRQSLGEAAVAIGRAVGYVGAGTVEFLLAGQSFFFLEMNTRLQVEHPVTEETTGLDLVRLQLQVASGSPLPDEALSPRQVGHAIEARLYAEDPVHEFLPVTGTIDRFEFPDRTGLRVDSGVTSGDSVSVFYDPMLAKVIAWAETRDEAAALLAHSLQRAELHGPTTNRELLVRILRHPEFVAGATDTHFLERHNPATLGAPLPDQTGEQLAALAAALAAQSERRASAVLQKSIPSGWRNSPSQPQRFVYQGYHGQHSIAYRFDRAGLTVVLPGAEPRPARIHQVTPVRIGLELDGHLRWYRINRVDDVIHVDGPTGYSRLKELPRFPPPIVDDDPGSLHAPMPGTVVRVLVEVGNEVLEGQAIVVLEAMKMEHTLRAPHDGIVKDVRAEAGQQVEADRILVVLEPR